MPVEDAVRTDVRVRRDLNPAAVRPDDDSVRNGDPAGDNDGAPRTNGRRSRSGSGHSWRCSSTERPESRLSYSSGSPGSDAGASRRAYQSRAWFRFTPARADNPGALPSRASSPSMRTPWARSSPRDSRRDPPETSRRAFCRSGTRVRSPRGVRNRPCTRQDRPGTAATWSAAPSGLRPGATTTWSSRRCSCLRRAQARRWHHLSGTRPGEDPTPPSTGCRPC